MAYPNGTTIKAPTGTTKRTGSRRRFVLCREYVPGNIAILYRTDDVDRAIKARAKNSRSQSFIWDQLQGKVLE